MFENAPTRFKSDRKIKKFERAPGFANISSPSLSALSKTSFFSTAISQPCGDVQTETHFWEFRVIFFPSCLLVQLSVENSCSTFSGSRHDEYKLLMSGIALDQDCYAFIEANDPASSSSWEQGKVEIIRDIAPQTPLHAEWAHVTSGSSI